VRRNGDVDVRGHADKAMRGQGIAAHENIARAVAIESPGQIEYVFPQGWARVAEFAHRCGSAVIASAIQRSQSAFASRAFR
ncbi:MAG: hypothetical protein NT176_01855, partial [Proteobacteria bacterium]|nr:hypothetical protein [Pseudomonadota bacterium]